MRDVVWDYIIGKPVEAIDPLTLTPAIYWKANTLNLSNESSVLKLPDLSGNEIHATEPVATAPVIYNGFNNNKSSIHFDGNTRLSFDYTGTGNDFIISMLVRPESNGFILAWTNGIEPFFGINSTLPTYYKGSGVAGSHPQLQGKWIVLTVRVIGTNCRIYIDNNQVAEGTITAAPLRGITLGWLSGFGWIGKIQEVAVFNGTRTDAQLSGLIAYFCNEAGIYDAPQTAWAGDSITEGIDATDEFGYVAQLATKRRDLKVYNDGNSGDVIAQVVARAQASTNKLAKRLNGFNAYGAFVGGNDLFAGTMATTVITDYTNLSIAQRALGWKFIAFTVPERSVGAPTGNAQRLIFNAWLRATPSVYDALVDADAIIGLANLTDGVHPDDEGHRILSEAAEIAYDSLDLLPTPITQVLPSRTTDGIQQPIKDALDALATSAKTDVANTFVPDQTISRLEHAGRVKLVIENTGYNAESTAAVELKSKHTSGGSYPLSLVNDANATGSFFRVENFLGASMLSVDNGGNVIAPGSGTHRFGSGGYVSTVEMTAGVIRTYEAGGSSCDYRGQGASSSGTFYLDSGASAGIMIRTNGANQNAVQFASDGASTFYAPMLVNGAIQTPTIGLGGVPYASCSIHVQGTFTRAILLNRSEIGTGAGDGTYFGVGSDGIFSLVNQENAAIKLYSDVGVNVINLTSGLGGVLTAGAITASGAIVANGGIVLPNNGSIIGSGAASLTIGDSNDSIVFGAANNYWTGNIIARGPISNDSGNLALTGPVAVTGAITASGIITRSASAYLGAFGNYLTCSQAGAAEVQLQTGLVDGYGGTVSVGDGSGAYARLEYNSAYPQLKTSRASFGILGSGFSQSFSSAEMVWYLNSVEQFRVDGSFKVARPVIVTGAITASGNLSVGAGQTLGSVYITDQLVFQKYSSIYGPNHPLYSFFPLHFPNATGGLWFSSLTTLSEQAAGTLQIGTAGANNATGSLACAAITASSTVTSVFSSSSADLSTLDLSAGQNRLHKNTTSSDLKLFANDGGTIKSVTLT